MKVYKIANMKLEKRKDVSGIQAIKDGNGIILREKDEEDS